MRSNHSNYRNQIVDLCTIFAIENTKFETPDKCVFICQLLQILLSLYFTWKCHFFTSSKFEHVTEFIESAILSASGLMSVIEIIRFKQIPLVNTPNDENVHLSAPIQEDERKEKVHLKPSVFNFCHFN
uniref:Uncharacterized protein n=1 Tax=Trichobilharzia regenti TaxID=157069 RepID=A0AA85J0V6_TRIRE|nr:unnamed protein product [Trichobilharzia regenti]